LLVASIAAGMSLNSAFVSRSWAAACRFVGGLTRRAKHGLDLAALLRRQLELHEPSACASPEAATPADLIEFARLIALDETDVLLPGLAVDADGLDQ
jgi:hypothetical protein